MWDQTNGFNTKKNKSKMERTQEGKINSADTKHEEKSQTESLSEVTSFAEISTEDTELSLTDVSFITVRTSGPEVIVKYAPERLYPAEKEQPNPLFSSNQRSQETSRMRSQDSLKTTTGHSIPADEADPCAALLLACLFCQPLDCLLSAVRACDVCVCWLCSSLCGCEGAVLLDVGRLCGLCGCWEARRCLCDCPLCDICLQATECLDLAMEISQMLYH